jgi:outer membrane beta-barrel protein
MKWQPTRRDPQVIITVILKFLVFFALVSSLQPAYAADAPAEEALAEANGKEAPLPLIQNRFFLKKNRFEFGPSYGYIPNNAFVTSQTAGLVLAYHFSEDFAVEAYPMYGIPGSYKNLTVRLVQIANESGNSAFQQPADQLGFGAIFAARWAPVYGKINLIGEGVLNFDLYGTLGAGIIGISSKYYVYNDDPALPVVPADNLETPVYFGGNIGIGMNFFLNQFVALKLDARGLPYWGKGQDYGQAEAPEPRLYVPFVASGTICFFVPKMKPRMFNF